MLFSLEKKCVKLGTVQIETVLPVAIRGLAIKAKTMLTNCFVAKTFNSYRMTYIK